MASRRQGARVFNSIFQAVKAQLAAGGSSVSSGAVSQFAPLYPDLVQPQQLTSLKHFSSTSLALSSTTTGSAEGLAVSVAKAKTRAPRRNKATAKQGKSAKDNNIDPPSTDAASGDVPDTRKTQRSKREAVVSRKAIKQQSDAAQPSISLPSYHELKANTPEQRLPLTAEGIQAIKRHIDAFRGSAHVQDQSLALYVNSKLFYRATNDLENFIYKAVTQDMVVTLVANDPGPATEDAMFGLFAEYVVHNHSAELQSYRTRVQMVDMRQSHLWYPVARALQRKIIYHAGPTNSGKTYQALKAMKEAKTGIYCGPLRLLAMEVFDSVNQEGIHCNLHTGQERQVLAGAKHVSCTIEMINTAKQWDCAVIDEIQMIGDDQRGWAWTRALQGLPANEIHLCGDASALPLVKQMCEDMGEPLSVMNYNRFTDLEIQPGALPRDYTSVEPGDCIVAFSRRDIFDIKTDIERRTNHKCCVIYGALPPEMRRHQAALFNEPNNGFDILVASDAVGMGLNLNIRRVIFHKVQKFEGYNTIPVSTSQIKQIAGRAGRRSSIYPKGFVGTRASADLPTVTSALNMPLNMLSTPAAGLFPEFQHLELLAGQVPDDKFADLLRRFSNEAKLEGTFFFCRQDGVMQIAKLLENVDNLSLEDRFDFCMAPANIRDSRMAAALLHFAARYSNGMPATLDIALPDQVPATAEELRHIEATHQVMSLWIWLSHRFGPEAFPGLEAVAAKSEAIIELMNQGLTRMCEANKEKVRKRPKAAYQSLSKSVVLLFTGTSLMEEVFINQETDPYVLEVDGRLDLAALQLQPASIVINSKKGLVDAQSSKTKRTFADIQHKVLHDTTAGSKANPLNVSGAFAAVTDKSKKRRLPSDTPFPILAASPGVGRNSTPDLALLAPHGLAFLAEFKLGLDDKAQPQALRYFEQLCEETWPEVLNQSVAATFIIEMMGAGLRIGGAAWGDRIYYEALTPV
ncbi:hypothetical protein WJX82_011160 [Trebouxia sp. C0006]